MVGAPCFAALKSNFKIIGLFESMGVSGKKMSPQEREIGKMAEDGLMMRR